MIIKLPLILSINIILDKIDTNTLETMIKCTKMFKAKMSVIYKLQEKNWMCLKQKDKSIQHTIRESMQVADVTTSATRLGDILDFGQPKAFGNN